MFELNEVLSPFDWANITKFHYIENETTLKETAKQYKKAVTTNNLRILAEVGFKSKVLT